MIYRFKDVRAVQEETIARKSQKRSEVERIRAAAVGPLRPSARVSREHSRGFHDNPAIPHLREDSHRLKLSGMSAEDQRRASGLPGCSLSTMLFSTFRDCTG